MKLITVGDIVNINYKDRIITNVTVLYTPQDTGDMWYFKGKDGKIIAQNPQSAELISIIKMPYSPRVK